MRAGWSVVCARLCGCKHLADIWGLGHIWAHHTGLNSTAPGDPPPVFLTSCPTPKRRGRLCPRPHSRVVAAPCSLRMHRGLPARPHFRPPSALVVQPGGLPAGGGFLTSDGSTNLLPEAHGVHHGPPRLTQVPGLDRLPRALLRCPPCPRPADLAPSRPLPPPTPGVFTREGPRFIDPINTPGPSSVLTVPLCPGPRAPTQPNGEKAPVLACTWEPCQVQGGDEGPGTQWTATCSPVVTYLPDLAGESSCDCSGHVDMLWGHSDAQTEALGVSPV